MLCWEKSSTFCVQSIDIDPLTRMPNILSSISPTAITPAILSMFDFDIDPETPLENEFTAIISSCPKLSILRYPASILSEAFSKLFPLGSV